MFLLDRLLKIWRNVSVSAKLYVVVGTMATLVIVELFTLHFAMGNLSAVRAFVGGEASWSKAQKNAVYRLQRYALTKNEEDYKAFHESLVIPAGDRLARMELEKPNPDMEIVKAGFVQGRIHVDDVEPMVLLLKRFHNVSYIATALNAWREGDRLIMELKAHAEKYYSLVVAGEKDTVEMQKILDEIVRINRDLTQVEETFSAVLGEGSRWMERIILIILIVVVLTVESIGLTLTFLTSKALTKGLADLNSLSHDFGRGHFEKRLEVDSQDEIGNLTKSINHMGDMLKKSYSDLRTSHRDLELKVQQRTAELAEIASRNSELYNEAKTAIKMRDDFLSIASHELRTPLTALNLQLYQLDKLTSSATLVDIEDIKKISHRAFVQVKKLSDLQSVLMDLAQIRLGKLEIKKERCDVTALASECISQLAFEVSKTKSEIVMEGEHPVIGDYDPIRVTQVITNLLTNALKYGEGRPVKLSVYAEDGQAVIIVRDNGQGIPEDKQKQIFERFERVYDDPAVSGLGLGLYIAKQIVDAHHGTIIVESDSKNGTEFIVKLPQHVV